MCAVGVFAWATSAAAYCRTMSCELGEDPEHPTCPRDPQGCVTKGNHVHWASACLNYAVQVDGSAESNLDADQAQALAEEAFRAWKSAECPGGGSPKFEAHFQGFVACDRRESVCAGAGQNVNVLMFHDSSWPHNAGAIGVTTLNGGTSSGLVVDADVEINSQNFPFNSDDSGTMRTSLLYVLAHEFGHFLGLAHSGAPGALMGTNYQSLPMSQNLLGSDDVAAICAAYPPGAALDCAASGPAYDNCQYAVGTKPPECKLASLTQDSSSCSCRLSANGGRPSSVSIAALGILLATLVQRRRARGSKRAP